MKGVKVVLTVTVSSAVMPSSVTHAAVVAAHAAVVVDGGHVVNGGAVVYLGLDRSWERLPGRGAQAWRGERQRGALRRGELTRKDGAPLG